MRSTKWFLNLLSSELSSGKENSKEMDNVQDMIDAPKQFFNDSVTLLNRCKKPDQKGWRERGREEAMTESTSCGIKGITQLWDSHDSPVLILLYDFL